MSHPAQSPVRVQLCVVGCGPTGVAALLEARRSGVDAVGLEAGSTPLAAIAAHPEGVVYISEPSQFEVAGLPLDCRHPKHLVREDVLHYYTRIINWAGLRIHTRSRCIRIEPRARDVAVTVELAPGAHRRVIADEVLVTSWYARRQLEAEDGAGADAPRVIATFRTAADLAGQRVVVVGGGMSGVEYAAALMMSGASVTLVLRGPPKPAHTATRFASLLRDSRSTLAPCVDSIRLCAQSVELSAHGARTRVPCDTVLQAVGAEPDPCVLQMLVDARVLDRAMADAIRAAPTFEDATRALPAAPVTEQLAWVAERRPDLWSYLFDGVARVRLAGGVLHGGGQHAGVFVSIATARLAVRAMRGVAPPDWHRPLTHALTDVPAVVRAAVQPVDIELVKRIRPLPVQSWSRVWMARGAEQGSPGFDGEAIRSRMFGPDESSILELANGERSVADLLDSPIGRRHGVVSMLSALRSLWYHHALTWLPPSDRSLPSSPGERRGVDAH